MGRSTRRPRLRALIPLLAAALAPAASPTAAPTPACAPAPGDAAVSVVGSSDDGDVLLADGRNLRLVGIDLPRATPAEPDLPARLRAGLLGWAVGPLVLHAVSASPDRWSRTPALLFRPDGSSAAVALARAGLARMAPDAAAHACAADLLAAEAEARAARRGLWADPRYAVLSPADLDGLAAQAGGLALVQGILRVHESRGALYLALGRGRRGFTAVVSRRDRRGFDRAGLDLRDYEGTPVRLRGDLDARFGPRMRLAVPDGFESLEPGSLIDRPASTRHGLASEPALP